ncbi:MAG TPA: HD domain-containing phosphohydrolase, partial [Candidatus Limnocylindria bacterium]|nr:HD domain-containing phosphohydrolase [Candidatus Limnocylindria bacterium]
HHEWFNGSGYPDGLEALDIPLGARILGVADSYEAMTSARPYRKVPLTHEQAVAELEKYAGIQFDPEIVPVLIGLDREILDRHPERDDELPTMLGQSDPRDQRPDDTDRQPEQEPGQEQEREDEKRQLPAPRAAMVGRLYEDRESTQRRTRPVLADDVS